MAETEETDKKVVVKESILFTLNAEVEALKKRVQKVEADLDNEIKTYNAHIKALHVGKK